MTPEIAHQYKIRLEKAKDAQNCLFGAYWDTIDIDLAKAEIKLITRDEAEKIILEYEWLGNMSPKSRHHFGIFFGGMCGGVVCYGTNATSNAAAAKEFGLHESQMYTLARGACVHWTPKGSASKLISTSLRMLKQLDPKVRMVIAYSDTDAGEIGTVYQATNWLYIGIGTRATYQFYHPQLNKLMDERVLDKFRKKWQCERSEVKKKLKDEGWEIRFKSIKHKYIYLLGNRKENKEILTKVTVQSYPKRVAGQPAEEVSRERCLASSQEG